MFRFRLSMETLETRDTPSSGRVTFDEATSVPPAAADPLPVLLVIANRDFGPIAPAGDALAADAEPAAATGGTIPVYWHVIRHGSGVAAGDDVVVDGPIITAEDGAGLVRPRTFAVVDRTQMGGANETITVDANRTEAPAGDYSAVVFVGGWGSSL